MINVSTLILRYYYRMCLILNLYYSLMYSRFYKINQTYQKYQKYQLIFFVVIYARLIPFSLVYLPIRSPTIQSDGCTAPVTYSMFRLFPPISLSLAHTHIYIYTHMYTHTCIYMHIHSSNQYLAPYRSLRLSRERKSDKT